MTRWLPRFAAAFLLVVSVFSLAFAESTKIDAAARSAIYWLRSGAASQSAGDLSTSRILGTNDVGELDCFIVGDASRAQLEAAGARVRSELPNGVFTAWIPVDAVDAVAALSTVTRIEGAQIQQTNLDSSVPTTNATLFRGPGPAFTGLNGAGVIVGDVDTGVDYKHDNFKDNLGNTRFLRIWDETDAGGPAGAAPYGSEWLPADLNAATAREKDLVGHGSHTMGIAGGDGSAIATGSAPAYTYAGMAPMGDLIMVRASTSGSFSNTSLIDGINYIFGRATAFGKPAVVNMSIGGSSGPHDGSSTFETTVDAMCGAGRTVVFSAGNDGGTHIHARVNATAGGQSSTMLFSGTGTTLNRRFVIDGYYNATEVINVTVRTPNGTVIGPITLGNNNAAYPGTATANGAVYVENGISTSANGSREVYIDIINNVGAGMNLAGTWTYTFTAVSLGAANGQVDQWRFFQSSTAFTSNFVAGDDPAHTLLNGLAGGQNTFAAGAWVSKQFWTDCNGHTTINFTGSVPVGNLATFSSTGPTRDGRPKPEVAAPGTAIVSVESQDFAVACPLPTTTASTLVPGLQHVVMQGTSMAAPHMTGAIALLFQKYGASLTPAQLRTLLSTRAVVDGFVTSLGAVPNPSFGYGKLNLGDMSDPLCAVTFPNGGEVLVVGDLRTLTWNASDAYQGVTGVDIEVSRDNGSNWSPIASNVANTGSFNWTVTGPVTPQALLRVTARDAAGNTGVDLSDQTWVIDDPVATTLTLFRAEATPDGIRIEWQFADPSEFSNLSLERATVAQGPWTVLDAEMSQDGARTVALDRTAEAGHSYFYRISGTYRTGGSEVFGPLVATGGEVITEFALKSAAPNPTDAGSTIEYTVPRTADVSLQLFDLQGREVATLAKGQHTPGRYHATWNGKANGAQASAGIYFLHMKAPGMSQTRRIVVSR